MVGRTIYEAAPEMPDAQSASEVVLEVRNLNRGSVIKDVSFQLKTRGDPRLRGAGGRRAHGGRARHLRRRPDRLRRGVRRAASRRTSSRRATRCAAGIGYLSEDRKRYGLALGMDVETNIVLATFRKFMRRARLGEHVGHRATSKKYVDALAIKTPASSRR